MSRVIVYGNGKSRQKWNVNEKLDDVVTWGCNRIFNDIKVDNLVAMDYHIQHLIHESGYAKNNKCWFKSWNVIDEDDMIENIDFPKEWSSGATAVYLACQQGATEIYLMGFDISDDPKDNVYEREQNEYRPEIANYSFRLDWAEELKTVFTEFKKVKFIWAEPASYMNEVLDIPNTNESNAVINKSVIGCNRPFYKLAKSDRLILDNDNLTYDTYENIRRNICR